MAKPLTPEEQEAVNKRLEKFPLGGPDELALRLAMERMGVTVTRHDDPNDVSSAGSCGNFALFPMAAKDSVEWEKRTQEMHDAQEHIDLSDLEAKEDDAHPLVDESQFIARTPAPHKGSKVRGATVRETPEDLSTDRDELPEKHRSGHGTIGMGIIKV